MRNVLSIPLNAATQSRFVASTLSVQLYSLSPASQDPSSSSSSSLTTSDLATLSSIPLRLTSEADLVASWERAERGRDLGVIWNERVREGDPRAVAAAREQVSRQAKAQQQQQQQQPAQPSAKQPSVKAEPNVKAAAGAAASAPAATSAPRQQAKSGSASPVKDVEPTKKPKGASGLDWSRAKSVVLGWLQHAAEIRLLTVAPLTDDVILPSHIGPRAP